MPDETPLTAALDEAWSELVADALASDGPIRDSDVKDAVRRNRPHIEAATLDAERSARVPAPADGLVAGGVEDWLDSSEGRIEDLMSLWTQGKRTSRWVAEQLIDEGHLANLLARLEADR